ncbi:SDR family NAD(P)-dependent oxidoreductase [Albimonas sp. CAU 1670]|uniref:SDR family NAD(P)-dependent oxidoreductase n=1 Tax=Albimonas sp. CAU 1670 TaxID=3032599 RepID=UPI0023DCC106|nr:SDR family NAD(P)-dependent oxidoreductase [Albimonas sp. CAU 1670]MDF2233722.1 SDR family NAD(P)-dependent oxidoreductase [Albimonas sp. CAU 1670]
MSRFEGRVCAITGAGSGIGRALALELAARGARLALADVAQAGLDETAAQARERGAEVETTTLDVCDPAALAAWAEATEARFGAVHQLYNNAGISRGSGPFLEMRQGAFERIVEVNLWGVIHGTRAFLPRLVASGDGALVNISSLNGLMAQAGLSAYCASKFAVRGFTEAIRVEMLMAKAPVQVVVVHPGGVATNIARAGLADLQEAPAAERARAEASVKVYEEKLLKMPPETAARVILDGVARGRTRIVVTRTAVWLDRFIRLFPERYPVRVAAEQAKLFPDRGSPEG